MARWYNAAVTQDLAFSILTTGQSVFLTGEPGSGKTHTVNRYVAWLHDNRVAVAVTASTGIAATHIGGMTIHSWSGIGIKRTLTAQDYSYIADNARVARRIRHASVLIIDEVSMLSGDTLSLVDQVCRKIRKVAHPFGGLQVVLVGDFFQLPPIVSRQRVEESDMGGQISFVEEQKPPSVWAFDSVAWKALSPVVCYLSEQHRHEDPVFVELLGAIRKGTVTEAHRETLSARRAEQEDVIDEDGFLRNAVSAPGTSDVTRLYSHNVDVDRMNGVRLAALAEDERVFTMDAFGAPPLIMQLKKGCLSPERLVLKIGARVMFTKNDPQMRFVNGTIATVTGFDKGSGQPIVLTKGGRSLVVAPVSWGIEADGKLLAEVVQVPLRLAWAITVHKSQGMSLDAAHMNLSDTFEYGQGYVALSRLRRLEGLTLEGLNERALQVHPQVQVKDAEFRLASVAVEKKCAVYSEDVWGSQRRAFLNACGVGSELATGAKGKSVRERGRGKSKKADTCQTTLDFVRQGKNVREIAALRHLTLGTIISHLEKLHARDELTPPDFETVLAGIEPAIAEVHDAFAHVGAERLTPAFEYLKGSVPFETIRLALLTYKKDSVEGDPQAVVDAQTGTIVDEEADDTFGGVIDF